MIRIIVKQEGLSGRVSDLGSKGSLVRDSLEALCCVFNSA